MAQEDLSTLSYGTHRVHRAFDPVLLYSFSVPAPTSRIGDLRLGERWHFATANECGHLSSNAVAVFGSYYCRQTRTLQSTGPLLARKIDLLQSDHDHLEQISHHATEEVGHEHQVLASRSGLRSTQCYTRANFCVGFYRYISIWN